jgi:hypothetical protein
MREVKMVLKYYKRKTMRIDKANTALEKQYVKILEAWKRDDKK